MIFSGIAVPVLRYESPLVDLSESAGDKWSLQSYEPAKGFQNAIVYEDLILRQPNLDETMLIESLDGERQFEYTFPTAPIEQKIAPTSLENTYNLVWRNADQELWHAQVTTTPVTTSPASPTTTVCDLVMIRSHRHSLSLTQNTSEDCFRSFWAESSA